MRRVLTRILQVDDAEQGRGGQVGPPGEKDGSNGQKLWEHAAGELDK
jgi:hypothetical protein